MNDSLSEAIRLLNKKNDWLLLCHENPDIDTLGSALALCSIAKRLGKRARVIGKDPLPSEYGFLPGASLYTEQKRLLMEDVCNALIVFVDISTVERSLEGACKLASSLDSLAIDHHGDNKLFCKVNLVDAVASATAEIITNLALTARWGVSYDEAVCLYAALVTDNGNFRFSSVTPETHRCAAVLLSAGVRPNEIDNILNETLSPSIIRMWGLVYSRTEISTDGKCAFSRLTREEFLSAGGAPGSTEGLVNTLLRIKGVKIAAFLTETEDSNRASIRTKAPYSARELAAVFGGGGHICAAGTKVPGTHAEAYERIKEEAKRYAAHGLAADR